MSDEGVEVDLHFADLVGFCGIWNGLGEDFVDAGEVAEEQSFRALEFVDLDVIGEGPVVLEHFPHDGFGADVFLSDPRVAVGEGVEAGVDELAQGFGVLEFLEFLHPVQVIHALLFELGEFLRLHAIELTSEDGFRILEDGFHDGEEVEGVEGVVGVELGEGLDEVEREHLVHGEILLQIGVDPELGLSRGFWCREEFNDPAFDEGSEQLPGAAGEGFSRAGWFVAGCEQIPHRAASIAGAAEHVEQHSVVHLESGDQAFRRGLDESLEGVAIPGHEVLLRGFAFGGLFAVARRFFPEFEILDDMFGGLNHDPADVIEPLASGASGNLVEVARAEDPGFFAVKLAEAGEEDGADGDVDPDAEGIGSADDFEQAFLGELLGEHAVFGEESGVVDADSVFQPFSNFRSVGAGEFEPFDGGADGGLFLPGADVQAGEILCVLGGFALGEVDDVDGTLAVRNQGFEGLCERGLGVGEFERDGPMGGGHGGGGESGEVAEFLLEEGGVPERGGHEEEPGFCQREQRDLPGDTPLAVGVIMEFIHHDIVHPGACTLAKGDVSKNFGGATEDGGVAIDGGVPGAEAHVIGTEFPAERHPFLVDQGFDGAGVDRAPPAGDGVEVEGGGDQAFPRARGRVQDEVVALEEFKDGGFLGRVEGQAACLDIIEECEQERVAVGRAVFWQVIVKGQVRVRRRAGVRGGRPAVGRRASRT